MQNNNTTLNVIGGFITAGLVGLAAFFIKKIEKETEETERMIRETEERMRRNYENFNSELVSFEKQKAEALEPFGKYLDDLKVWFEEQEALIQTEKEL